MPRQPRNIPQRGQVVSRMPWWLGNRRWLLTWLSAGLAITAGWLTPALLATELQRTLAYPLAIVALLGCGWSLTHAWQHHSTGRWPWGRIWAGLGVLVALLATALVHFQASHGYRTLFDEPLISATAQAIHLERQAFVGTVVQTDLDNAYLVPTTPDKRPVLLATLVALVHDLTGYRVANIFWVNGLLTAIFFGLLFVAVARWGRSPWAGLLAVVAWLGLPLAHHQFTGAGFELLNLVLLLLWVWVARRCVSATSLAWCGVLGWVAILLAYTRYESAMMTLPTAVIWIWVLYRRRSIELPAVAPWLPWLCLPALWIVKIHATDATTHLQLNSPDQSAFGIEYVIPNFSHFLNFFFFADSNIYLNSVPLAIAGVAGGIFWGVSLFRQRRVVDTVWLLWLGSIGAYFCLLLVFVWADMRDLMVGRLALPLFLGLTVLAGRGAAWLALRLSQWCPRQMLWMGLVIAFTWVFPAVVVPAKERQAYLRSSSTFLLARAQERLMEREGAGIVLIGAHPVLNIPHRVMQLTFAFAIEEEQSLRLLWDQGRCRSIWIVREGTLVNRRFVPLPGQEVPESWPLVENEVIPTGLGYANEIARVDFGNTLPPGWIGLESKP